MLFMDGSPHEWVPGQSWTLLGAIDDATNKVPAALFASSENTRYYLLVLQQILLPCGIPASGSDDKHSVCSTTCHASIPDHIKGGAYPLTQLARAVTALGIRFIYANSPQAKGRLERLSRNCAWPISTTDTKPIASSTPLPARLSPTLCQSANRSPKSWTWIASSLPQGNPYCGSR